MAKRAASAKRQRASSAAAVRTEAKPRRAPSRLRQQTNAAAAVPKEPELDHSQGKRMLPVQMLTLRCRGTMHVNQHLILMTSDP